MLFGNMPLPDVVNGLFETFGGFMVWLNVHTVLRDKIVRGVSSAATWVFTAWALWNLYYYPSLGQWASFVGGGVIVSGNVAWCICAWRYRDV